VKRREFITLLGGAAAFTPSFVHAQEGRIYRLGVLNILGRQAPPFAPFFDELRQLGFTEGGNLIVDARGFAARTEQFPSLALELANAKVDAILCGGPDATRAAQKATRTIPILGNLDDFVAAGLVSSLAHPEGNTTGVSFLATELDGKRQEILMELMPAARRMAALMDVGATAPKRVQALQDATRARGVELAAYVVDRPERILAIIEEAQLAGAQALNLLASPALNAHRFDIFERTQGLRLPTIYQWPENAKEGGLVAYGPRYGKIYRQLARQLAKLLRGAKPSEIPIEQPTSFDLAINTRVAKALDLTVPPQLLARADEVIE
jgi:putative tryptophan/tyrosine transport system substrate-binding protein